MVTPELVATEYAAMAILLLPPLIALFRMIKAGERAGRRDLVAAALFVLVWAFGMAPAQVLSFEDPWGGLFKVAKTITWVALLVVLIIRTHRARPT